ncbi:MAG: tetratricopeptide repeat protein [Chloroflexi bacterium]|nr:tetratricopeptide repeat protein [Chloroflexota bacterium]
MEATPANPLNPSNPIGRPASKPQTPSKTIRDPLTPAEQQQVEKLLDYAETAIHRHELETAIKAWVAILDIRVDHPEALAKATKALYDNYFTDDAWTLMLRALRGGSTSPTVYLLGIELAENIGRWREADEIRVRLARLPDADPDAILKAAHHLRTAGRPEDTIKLLEAALKRHMEDQALWLALGDLYCQIHQTKLAVAAYDRAARLGPRTEDGKKAEAALLHEKPIITEDEQRSFLLAMREAVAVSLLFLLMGFQDAGLDFWRMGGSRWLGVGLSLLGGYLLVTATSGSRQYPLGNWLGNKAKQDDVSEIAPEIRTALGLIGVALLVMSFKLVAPIALSLLTAQLGG